MATTDLIEDPLGNGQTRVETGHEVPVDAHYFMSGKKTADEEYRG